MFALIVPEVSNHTSKAGSNVIVTDLLLHGLGSVASGSQPQLVVGVMLRLLSSWQCAGSAASSCFTQMELSAIAYG